MFVKRIVAVTNLGIMIFKDVDAEIKCPDCPASRLCPRGPTQDFNIPYNQIIALMTFPQIPQKLVLKFQVPSYGEDNKVHGLADLLMTLNIKTLMKAARIYQAIMGFIDCMQEDRQLRLQHDSEKLTKWARGDTPEDMRQVLRLYHIDTLVQYELRKLIQ